MYLDKKHPIEVLDDSQLDEIMDYDIPMSDVNMQNMYSRFQRERKMIGHKKTSKRLAAVLVAVAAVALVGFTNADRIQRLFYNIFGGTVQLEQNDYHEIGESVTDQGFRMNMLYAVRDGENLYLLVDLIDIEQDRLSDDLYIDHCFVEGISKNLGENVASMSGIKADLLEYDSARKTATLGIHATGGFENEDATFTLNGFSIGKTIIDLDASDIDLYDIVKNTQPSFQPFDISAFGNIGIGANDPSVTHDNIKKCLALDKMDVRIPGYENACISNIAYKDGFLHMQIKYDYIGHGHDVTITLRHTETGEELVPLYTLSYGVNNIDYPEEERGIFPDYHNEEVFKLDSLEVLKDYSLYAEGHYYQDVYQGKWQIRFTAPREIASVELPAPKTIMVNEKEINIKKVTVTPLSVTVLSEVSVKDSFDVTLIYDSGDRKVLTNNGMYTYESGEQEWIYSDAFSFQSIAEVEINGTRFNLPRSN